MSEWGGPSHMHLSYILHSSWGVDQMIKTRVEFGTFES